MYSICRIINHGNDSFIWSRLTRVTAGAYLQRRDRFTRWESGVLQQVKQNTYLRRQDQRLVGDTKRS